MMYIHYSHPICGINLCHTTQHTTQIPPLPHPTPPLHLSSMTSTPSKSSKKSSINLIGPNKELPDFADIARDIQNRASCHAGSELTEARVFGKFFGTSVRTVKIIFELVVCNRLQPSEGRLKHLLWMLYFMKVYPKQGPRCLVVAASTSAIDPKTHRKWVWAFIEAIAQLVDVVVSNTTM